MSVTALLLLFTLPNVALAEEGCEADSIPVEEEGAYYLEGMGCVVGDISLYCEDTNRGDCWSWDQVVARYEDSPEGAAELFTMDCAEGSDYAHRWNLSSSEWQTYLYYDDSGFAAGLFGITYGNPWCCDGVETTRRYFGDPYATCIEPTDTGDTADTPKTGPCGGGSGGSAAALGLLALLTIHRRGRV
jgi:hypothetical protein